MSGSHPWFILMPSLQNSIFRPLPCSSWSSKQPHLGIRRACWGSRASGSAVPDFQYLVFQDHWGPAGIASFTPCRLDALLFSSRSIIILLGLFYSPWYWWRSTPIWRYPRGIYWVLWLCWEKLAVVRQSQLFWLGGRSGCITYLQVASHGGVCSQATVQWSMIRLSMIGFQMVFVWETFNRCLNLFISILPLRRSFMHSGTSDVWCQAPGAWSDVLEGDGSSILLLPSWHGDIHVYHMPYTLPFVLRIAPYLEVWNLIESLGSREPCKHAVRNLAICVLAYINISWIYLPVILLGWIRSAVCYGYILYTTSTGCTVW